MDAKCLSIAHIIDYRNKKDEDDEIRERTVKDILPCLLFYEEFSIYRIPHKRLKLSLNNFLNNNNFES